MAKFYTQEQIALANSVNLVDFLRMQGEKLIKSGKDMRWDRNHSVTLRDNMYHKWGEYSGGYPIQFLKEFYGYDFKQAMEVLLSTVGDVELINPLGQEEKEKKPFIVPEKNNNNRRAYAYLNRTRLIDNDVLNYFFNNNLIYEDKEYHNAVFVGLDEEGVIRHAHKRNTIPNAKSFRGNVESSDSRYPFHYVGTSNKIFVFEAPIDMLSYITLNKENWQEHNYIALNGLGTEGLEHMLDTNPNIQTILLCFDHDAAGIVACERITDMLINKGYDEIGICQPKNKDYNEDIMEMSGKEFKPPEEDPNREYLDIIHKEVCKLIPEFYEGTISILQKEFADLYYNRKDRETDYDFLKEKLLNITVCSEGLRARLYGNSVTNCEKGAKEKLSNELIDKYRSYKDIGILEKRIAGIKGCMENLKLELDNYNISHDCKKLLNTLSDLSVTAFTQLNFIEREKHLSQKIEISNHEKHEIKIAEEVTINNSLKKTFLLEEAKKIYECISNAKSYDDALSVIMECIEPNQVSQQTNENTNNLQIKGY